MLEARRHRQRNVDDIKQHAIESRVDRGCYESQVAVEREPNDLDFGSTKQSGQLLLVCGTQPSPVIHRHAPAMDRITCRHPKPLPEHNHAAAFALMRV